MALAKLDLRNIDFDLDGFLNAGGKLYTYAASTSTPQATYADADGTENANPIVFDSSGQYHLWLTEDLAYKFVFTNSADVPEYTENNVSIRGEQSTGVGRYVVAASYHAPSPPIASEALDGHVFDVAVTFEINFAGAIGKVLTAGLPTASFAIDVRRNATAFDTGESVGTITIATNGAYTFASAAAAEVTFDIGDDVTFWGPSSADATANDFKFTLIGDMT